MRGATAPDYILSGVAHTADSTSGGGENEGWSSGNTKGSVGDKISKPAPTAAVIAHIPEYQLSVMPHDGRVDLD